MEKPKYQIELDNYLNNPDDSYYLRIIDDKGVILINISQYISQSTGLVKEQLNDLYNNFDEIFYKEMSSEHLKDVLNKFRKNKSILYDYLYNFLYENEETINNYMKKKSIGEKDYIKMYKFFKKNFPNQENERKELVKAYHKYISPKNIDELIEKTNGNRDRYENRLVDLYLSNCSKVEYASKTGTWLTQINNTIKRFLDDEKSRFHKMALEVSKRSDDDITASIKLLALELLNNEDTDILYYFDNTRLCFQDFRTIIEPFFENSSLRKILEKVNKLKTIENDVIKDTEIEATTIINGVEVSKEEKINIFKYMEYKNYPNGLYQTVLRKYVAGKLDIELELDKKLIKK